MPKAKVIIDNLKIQGVPVEKGDIVDVDANTKRNLIIDGYLAEPDAEETENESPSPKNKKSK